jgi:HNH endonuclease
MNVHYPQVALRAEHRCEYCHAPEVVFNFPFEVEHIVPVSLGGDDTEANLALACRSCNLWKAAYVTGLDPESGIEVPLYHPRQDLWEIHFTVDAERGEIHGQRPRGRATVMRLRMNDPAQRAARQQWMRLGLFP